MTGFHVKTVSMPRLRWKQRTKDKNENLNYNNYSRAVGGVCNNTDAKNSGTAFGQS